jgi:hypothetical protein
VENWKYGDIIALRSWRFLEALLGIFLGMLYMAIKVGLLLMILVGKSKGFIQTPKKKGVTIPAMKTQFDSLTA